MPLYESAAAVSITTVTTFQIEILNFNNNPQLRLSRCTQRLSTVHIMQPSSNTSHFTSLVCGLSYPQIAQTSYIGIPSFIRQFVSKFNFPVQRQ